MLKWKILIHWPTNNSEKSIKLLGIEIDTKLSFEEQSTTLCNKASNQLNAIGRIQKFIDFKEEEVILNSSVCSGLSLSQTHKGPTNLFEIEKVRDRENYRKNQNFTNKAREFKFKCSEDFFVEKF